MRMVAMWKNGAFCIVGVMTLLLSGCGSNDGPHGGHNISWYNKHTTAATKEAKWCLSHLVTVKKHNSAMNSCQAALHSTPGGKVMLDHAAAGL